MGRSRFHHELQKYNFRTIKVNPVGVSVATGLIALMSVATASDVNANIAASNKLTSPSITTASVTIDSKLTNFKTWHEENLEEQKALQKELIKKGVTRPLEKGAYVAPVPKQLNEVADVEIADKLTSDMPVDAAVAPAAAPTQVASAAVQSVSGSGYPYAGAPFPNSLPDPWGMYQRQCVSYAAWKVAASGRHMPYWGGRGDASLWDDNARGAGIPVDGNPRPGDVAVDHSAGGGYGHVMYVEAVNGDGTILVSQYNARWNGQYSEETVSAAGLVFIHF